MADSRHKHLLCHLRANDVRPALKSTQQTLEVRTSPATGQCPSQGAATLRLQTLEYGQRGRLWICRTLDPECRSGPSPKQDQATLLMRPRRRDKSPIRIRDHLSAVEPTSGSPDLGVSSREPITSFACSVMTGSFGPRTSRPHPKIHLHEHLDYSGVSSVWQSATSPSSALCAVCTCQYLPCRGVVTSTLAEEVQASGTREERALSYKPARIQALVKLLSSSQVF